MATIGWPDRASCRQGGIGAARLEIGEEQVPRPSGRETCLAMVAVLIGRDGDHDRQDGVGHADCARLSG
jgi:hypothetical protein